MINFFPRIYDVEIVYSIFARYGVLNGDPGFGHTSNGLFGIKNSTHSVCYSMYLDNFINQIPVEMGITSDSFIKKTPSFLFANHLCLKKELN